MNLKTLVIVIAIVAAAIAYFSHASNKGGSNGQSEELAQLRMELEMNESLLKKIEKDIEKREANPRMCSGQEMNTTVTEDPRAELQEEIERLKEEIARLEDQ